MIAGLKDQRLIDERKIWEPEICSRATLKTGCSAKHLFLLNYSLYTSKIVELPLYFLPGCVTRHLLLNPMLLMTQGTIDGAQMALAHEKGVAINIGGGFHHSSRSQSGGFCIYPDITMAVNHLRDHFNVKKHMIIDLDAHQGDGHERDFIDDEDVHIVDFYNANVFPGDMEARKAIKTEFKVRYQTTDQEYLEKVRTLIVPAMDSFKPNFILYNAGTDISSGDPLGQLNISDDAIIERDEIIISEAISRKIPILMVLS